MNRSLLRPTCIWLVSLSSLSSLSAKETSFQAPRILQAAGKNIAVADPGYAAPSWADVNGDGREDLIVGQFAEGRVQIFDRKADGTLAEGRWLMVGKEIAKVPDIW